MSTTGALIQAIEAHLQAHPQAADSAEGVARWWLAGRGVAATPMELEAALAALVQQQRLRRVQLADGNTLYCGGANSDDEQPTWPM